MSIYSATKFAVRSLTQSAGELSFINAVIQDVKSGRHSRHIAIELAKHGITVNAYAPGECTVERSPSSS